MRTIDLNIAKRDTALKARVVRREGKIPGVLYGVDSDTVAIEFDAHEFSTTGLASHGAHLVQLKSDDAALGQGVALIKEIQEHPVHRAPVHVDLIRVDMTKPISASVNLAFVGKAAGTVEGGLLQPIRRELEIRALPTDLPEQIEVDVSELNIHDSIHVADLTLGEGVEAIYQENFTLVTVVPPVVEAVAEEEEEVEGEVAAGDAPAESAAESAEEGASE